ncbi:YfcC family protein [Gulosibacter bifidus]|uniref:YfcC family protein n=1 Tax=Gulosibacter bifidus TaxID=272239 RepID=A0ABW5RL18_9MICO|nr:TIGR00366 family protein [Gulosibacter bifidus]
MTTVNQPPTTKPPTDSEPKKRFNLQVPHTYAVILGIMVLVGIATYFIPSGAFERVEEGGREVVVPGSYEVTEKTFLSPFDLVLAVPQGLAEAVEIVFFVFLAGGAFAVIRATGAIDGAVGKLIKVMGKSNKLILPALMAVFSVLGFTMGIAEEMVIFVPITVGIATALGYDAMVGAAVAILGAAAGFIGGIFNPFTVGVAQSIAELELFSAAGFRTIVYFIILAAAWWWVARYAGMVKADPTKSVLYGHKLGPTNRNTDLDTEAKFGAREATVLLLLVGGLALNVYGVFAWEWFLGEMSAMFLLIGIVSGFIGGLGLNRTFDELVQGMADVAYGALIVGFARAILVVLENGEILDTVVNGIGSAIGDAGTAIAAGLMFIFQSLLNFFIPSGSGQAAATMPIMVPLADSIGMERQTAVLAFQYGDGISNSFFPTSGPLLSCLAIVGIAYDRWVKFVWPLILIWSAIAVVAVVVAALIGVA